MLEINAILTIASRDFLKLMRDRIRLIFSLVFPFIFVGILGSSLQANLSSDFGYNYLTFVFIGVIAQTLFQSTASGIISLVEDRENDFSQEIFVSPVSRYSIIFGKILGETLVEFAQIVGILALAIILQIPIVWIQLLQLIPFAFIVAFFGGAFGVLVMANLGSQRAANQVFPFIIFPQFFLAGVFNPIQNLPPFLLVLSRISPMTYAVDLFRAVYYSGTEVFDKVVLFDVWINLAVIFVMFLLFFAIGTMLFVKGERSR